MVNFLNTIAYTHTVFHIKPALTIINMNILKKIQRISQLHNKENVCAKIT